MIFDRSLGLFFQPMRLSIPYRKILNRWLAARFAPTPCRQALEEIIAEHRLPPQLFAPEAIEQGGTPATEALLMGIFEDTSRYALVVMHDTQRAYLGIHPRADVPRLGEVLRCAVQEEDADALRDRFSGHVEPTLLSALCQKPSRATPVVRWPEANAPGIYRREHASLLIRSRRAAVLLDPLALALGYFPKTLAAAPTNYGVERLDAVAITHTHDDHWHLPSVLRWTRDREMPVIVPQVPRACILSPEDPAATLRLCGQRYIDAPWGTTMTVGDIDIDILPFFGEQPTRLPPGPPAELRNWGNCYRFRAPDFSAVVLVDTGADPAGDMTQILAESRHEHGPPDVILSCVQEFPSPFFGGVATECLTLPFSRLRELFEELVNGVLPSTTAGPGGILRFCRASGARYFLPYANGFQALGRDNGIDWGCGPSEAAVTRSIAAELAARGIATQATAWNPGDALLFSGGQMTLQPLPAC